MIRRVGVVIPAANEDRYLAQCLRAVTQARDRLQASRAIEVHIVVVLDGCTDRSASIAGGADGVTVVRIDARRVGRARRVGCAQLLAMAGPSPQLLLANTDADSTVVPQWLAVLVELADSGAHVVLGTVRPERGLPGPVRDAWYARYSRAEGHPHVHGANFAIRADAYRRLGGWPDLATGEDHELARRADAAPGIHLVRTDRVPVETSARVIGRAPDGFSSYLRGLFSSPDARIGLGQPLARSS